MVAVGVAVRVPVDVAVRVGVPVAVAVRVEVPVAVRVAVAVLVGVPVKVDVRVRVAVAVGVCRHGHCKAHSLLATMVQNSSHGPSQQVPNVAWQTQFSQIGSEQPGSPRSVQQSFGGGGVGV
jgi:hypothetical protein